MEARSEHQIEPQNLSSMRAPIAALHEALIDAREGREYDTDRLRQAVRAVATAARNERLPPERLIILLKGLISDPAMRRVSYWWLRVLTDRFVRWGIEAYYGLE